MTVGVTRSRTLDGQMGVAMSRLPTPDQPGDYTLLLVVRPFVAPPTLPSQHIKLKVNGNILGVANVFGFCALKCDLPWDTLASSERLEVEIELPDAARPAEISGVRDQRQLALCLERAVLFSQSGRLVQGHYRPKRFSRSALTACSSSYLPSAASASAPRW